MPHGKPAGMPCVQLRDDFGCAIFGHAERPAVCASLQPHATMCGEHRFDALQHLDLLELQTAPAPA